MNNFVRFEASGVFRPCGRHGGRPPHRRPAVRAAVLLLAPLGGLICLAGLSGGCVGLAYFFGQEKTKLIPAEYPHLVDKQVCIVVRADSETTFEYPHVQFEIADFLKLALESNVRGTTVVKPRSVVDWQRSDAGWARMDPAAIGQRFDADRVLEVTLTQYTTREPDSPYLYRGHVAALVSVYNAEVPESRPVYEKEIRTVFPPAGATAWSAGDKAIRQQTLEAFAADVASKFYDRKVKVQ